MSAKIRVLDELTINKIAAGEVIENPASVVKELLENSLDAGATEIIVEVEAGGRALIRISDNGEGMVPDDALLAFERYATSKLKVIEDLYRLSSMGFRGEALPSIASISKLMLHTASKNSHQPENGTLITVEGGKMLSQKTAPRSIGTTMEVKDLFYNLPVRRKFLKSPAFDEAEIQKCLIIEALAHPTIKFQLIINQKSVLLLQPSNLADRIKNTLGAPFFKDLIPLEWSLNPYTVSGYISRPFSSRPNRSGQYLTLNGRPISSSFISWCLKEAYSTHLPAGRSPLFVVHLIVPYEEVDINVHPQKREVRLRNESELKRLIFLAVQEALAKDRTPPLDEWASQNKQASSSFYPLPWEVPNSSTFKTTDYTFPIFDNILSAPPAPSLSLKIKNPTPEVVCCIKSYIILLSPNRESISLIDHQRAHARILFEKLQKKEKIASEKIALLIPYTFELTKQDQLLFKENLEDLENMGFEIREFGPQSWAIEAYPTLYDQDSLEEVIHAYLADIREFSSSHFSSASPTSKWIKKAQSLSIHSDRCLTQEEASQLVTALFKCDNPYESPSSKPILIHLNRDEFAKQFQK